MRIKRAIIVSAILVFGSAGSIMAGSVVPAAAAQAPGAYAVHGFYYHV
jgi:hypothetical protein